jgi:hypothetical protein
VTPAGTHDTVMMICPNLKCRKMLRVPGQFRGQHVKCRYCQITFEVPIVRKPGDSGESSAPRDKSV